MPKFRKYIRGYNQAELITEELTKKLPTLTITHALMRNKSPKRQVTTRTRSERLLNQQGSFKTIENVTELNIILVDDVTTTGATLLEARKELLAHGAASVRCVTLAH